MKVFVCSRMNELEPERKAVIDSLFISGCTPVYFESLISAYDDRKAKKEMDEMVAEGEALILIYPRWKGKSRKMLKGQTPTQYEFGKFYQKIKREGRDIGTYIHVFRKSVITESEMDSFMDKFSDVKAIEYDNHVNLAGFSYDLGRRLRGRRDDKAGEILGSVVVRYNGPDFRGLLETLSDMLYRGVPQDDRTRYVANLDQISFASGAGVATLYISCSFVAENVPDLRHLSEFLNAGMHRQIAEAKKDYRLPRKVRVPRKLIIVSHGENESPPYQLYLEVRTIDQPGQLNAVARILRQGKYNVDELQLKPAEKGYPRQTLMALWISKERGQSSPDELERELVMIETAIRELAGVRSFSLTVTEMSVA